MYLGGLPTDRSNLILPTELWTAMLSYGYVGCIRDLFIDGRSKDIRQIAEAQNGAGIKPSCSKQPGKQCESYPCKNQGVCKEGWNRFICDCTGTGYWSRTCERGEPLRPLARTPDMLLLIEADRVPRWIYTDVIVTVSSLHRTSGATEAPLTQTMHAANTKLRFKTFL